MCQSRTNTVIINQNIPVSKFYSNAEDRYKIHILFEMMKSEFTIRNPKAGVYEIITESKNEEIIRAFRQMREIGYETRSRDLSLAITNNSDDEILFPIQNESLIAIIEAKDNQNNWKPIEFWPISGCGNSYYSKTLLPGQTLISTVNSNFGNAKTIMRLRLHGTDTIYISNEFVGFVDEDSFIVPCNAKQGFSHIMCDSIFFLEKAFFGNFNEEIEYGFMPVFEDE